MPAVSEAFVRAVGLATLLALAVAVVGAVVGLHSKIADVQLSGDPARVRDIVQAPGGGTDRMKGQLRADYVFIVAYWVAFVGLATMLARRGGGYRFVGLAAAATATATALLDVVENVRTAGLAALTRPGDQVRRPPVTHLRRTSLLKWAASAATLALLSVLLIPGTGTARLLGFGLLGAAAVGVVAVGIAAHAPRLYPVILAYLGLFLVVGGILGVWFVFWPGDLLAKL